MAGVASGVLYLFFASREKIICWFFAGLSSIIYLILFVELRLYFESALNFYYLAMAVYGWWIWSRGDKGNSKEISTMPYIWHIIIIIGGAMAVYFAGSTAERFTNADFPFLDAFTTVFGIITTLMVAQKKLENWLYWIVIDSVSLYLYIQKGLWLTSGLFIYYLIMCVYGYYSWRKGLYGSGN